MKFIKLFFGTLAGVYAVAQVFNLIGILTHSTGNVYQVSRIIAAVAAVLIGTAISIVLFKSALKKPARPDNSSTKIENE